MKKVLFSVALVMASCVAFGQTKAVKEAKRQADAKKFAEAEQLINQALENAETKDDANTWNVAGYVQQKINEEENTKAYLKQPFDTVKMYNSTYKMFEFFNKCDELEQIPNEKGKVKIRYRKANAATMQQNRPNLINGGVLYFNNGNDAEAYKYFSMYIDSAEYPMLKEANIAATDSMMPTIAYYTALAATKMAQEADQNNNKDAAKASYQNVLKYADLASNDKENGKFALEFKAGAYKALGDTAQWVATLQDGVQRFPAHSYFFGNYIDYCSNAGKYAEAVKFADDMIAKNGNSDFYQYVKGYLYQNMKEYDKAIAAYNGTCYLRLGRGGEKRIHDKLDNFQIGKAIKVKDGERVAIFSTGAIFEEVQGAYDLLVRLGYNPSVYTFPTVKPIDKEVIGKSATDFDLIVTCEEHNIVGGFGSAVAEVMAEMRTKRACLLRIGLNDEYSVRVGNQAYLRAQYEIDRNAIASKISNLLEKSSYEGFSAY